MSGDYIHREVLRIQAKYKTSDPYELLDALGAELRESCAYGPKGLKGYCYFSKRTIFVVINGCLSEIEQRIVAMHEAAFFAACEGFSAPRILKLEEDLAKTLVFDWKGFDVYGTIKL